jgi:gluconolactonase
MTRALATVLLVITQGLPPSPPGVSIERIDARFDRLVPADVVIERIADGLDWVEGPVWRPITGDLLFSNIPDNAVMRWHPTDGLSVFLRPSGYSGTAPFGGREPGSNGLTLDRESRLILCEHGNRRVTRLEANGTRTVLADRFEGRRLNSPNDVVLGPDGSLYFTDPPFGLPGTFNDPEKELPFQGVYRLSMDGALTAIIRDLRAPNGLAFSPDGRTLYVSHADRAHPVWMAYDVLEDGGAARGRVFATAAAFIESRPGAPDGLKVDRSGNVFAAGPGGVYVFAPDGTHLGSLLLHQPTGNVAWGEDGSTLFITSNDAVYRVRLATSGPLPGS